MQTKLLAFGHLPKFKGGKQRSGLAAVEWFIAHRLNQTSDSVNVVFCATDVHSPMVEIDGLPVVGWTMTSLVWAALSAPGRTMALISALAKLCRSYELPLLRTLSKAIHLNDTMKRISPDFIHLHGCDAAVYIRSGRFEAEKTIVTIHGIHGAEGPKRLSKLEATVGKLNLKALVFVTSQVAEEWVRTYGQPKSRVVVIPNAYDSSVFYRPAAAKKKGGAKMVYRLVSIGSVSDNKGQSRVVEAISRFQQMNPDYSFEYSIIGDSANNAEVKKVLDLASNLDVSVQHVPFLNPDQLREVIWESDFMILPSLKEGFGLVFLESIAAGTPVVLPKHLPICQEDGIISSDNAVFLEDASVDAILRFLLELPQHRFLDADVAFSLSDHDWQAVARQYSGILQQ